ncbi:MAG: histidine phosphatase family protein [Candidatus Accumulibacter sp.]|nr:histidine phosphatase family protein [Accumulibacter sp.]
MNLLLWRHAEAEDGWPDKDRKLTARGETQARQIAEWIRKRVSGDLHLLSSPALRCQQTARMLNHPFETDKRLGVDSDVTRLLLAADWPENDKTPEAAVIIVGHQPILGQTAARLLSGQDTAWQMEKGSLWWFSSWKARAVLKAVIPAEFAQTEN